MAKVLYITANPKEESKSYSLQVGRKFIEAYKTQNPQDEVVEIDVYSASIPLIDHHILSAWDKLAQGTNFSELDPEEQRKMTNFGQFTDQFVEADKYVFVTPMWNLSIPPMMKAYIDTVIVAGKTFKYTENGPVGLLSGKKAIHVQAAGGTYSSGPASEMEFGDSYIKTILNFIGVKEVNSILVEGIAYAPDHADEIKNKAIEKALEVAKQF